MTAMAISGNQVFPLSKSQLNIWRLEKAMGGLPLNNICCVLTVEGQADFEILKSAVACSLKAAPTLNTYFCLNNDELVQYISQEPLPPIAEYDFSAVPGGADKWADAVAASPLFALDKPLYFAAVFRVSECKCGVLLNIHHLLSDAWSHGLMMRRIVDSYTALAAGREADGSVLPGYREHVEEELRYLKGESFQRDKAFFKEYLSGVKPREAALNIIPVAERCSLRLPFMLSRLIGVCARREHVSPFLLILSALMIYEKRMRPDDTPAVGVPVFGRRTAKERRTPGMFVQTLPLYMPFDLDTEYSEFLSALNEKWFELLKHERCPYAEMEKGLHGQLFDIALSYQIGVTDEAPGERVKFEGAWHFSGYQAESLCVHIVGDGAGRRMDMDYRTQAYSRGQVEQMARSVFTILSDALQNPEKKLGALQMMNAEEEERLLDALYAKTPAYIPASAETMLLNAASAHADRVALISKGRRLRYKELLARAEKLKEELLALSLPEGAALALQARRGERLFEGICAALIAHIPFIIPDQAQPPARMEAILQIACAGAVLDENGIRKVTLANAPLKPEAELGYLVATSGSTGEPKLVEVPSAALANFARQMTRFYGRSAVLSLCNAAFDAFIIESAAALLNARTIVLADEEEMNDPASLAVLMRSYDASFLSLTPSRMSAYLTNEQFAAAIRRAESIILGGEPFKPALLAKLKGKTAARIYNQYGPSEATVAVAAARLDGAERITCGKALGGCRIYVLDDALRPVPPRAAGEICIAGECLALGYRGSPDETARRFTKTYFEDRVLRTGDLGCFNEEGELICLGRKDGQIKLNGRRVEKGEIEACLLRLPGVINAYVTVQNNILIAYLSGHMEWDEQAARSFALERLPSYMAPSAYVFMDKMPVTRNGKVDERALPGYQPRLDALQPPDENERVVLDIFRETLFNQQLTVTDEYFLSGGDSLTALHTIGVIKDRLNKRVTMLELHSHGTARALCALLFGARPSEQKPEAFLRAPEMESYPLSPEQKHFYALMRLDGGVAYNMPGAFQADGPLDKARLEKAFQALIALDDQFRVYFVEENMQVRAKYQKEASFALERAEGESAPAAFAAFVRPFDLTRAPLLRAAVYRENVLMIDMPHIISDGISGALLMQRLNALYQGRPIQMPAVRYRDYACAEEKRERKSDGYWERALTGFKEQPELPCDILGVCKEQSAEYSFELTEQQNCAVSHLAKRANVTPFSVLCSCYMLFLSFLTGNQDVCIGTPVTARETEPLYGVAGLMIETLPLRVKLLGSYGDIIKAVGAASAEMIDHRGVSAAELKLAAGSKSSAPLYRTLFSLLPASPDQMILGERTLSRIPAAQAALKTPFSMEAVKTEKGFRFSIAYDAARFTKESVAYDARVYATLLTNAERCFDEAPQMRHALDAADRVRLLDRPRRSRVSFDLTSLYDQIEENAILTPQATAVVTTRESISYQELLCRARKLAALLKKAGAKPNDNIGVYLPRDINLLSALLGIWAAGCAYVPFAESFPKERIAAMAKRAQVKLTLVGEESDRELIPGQTLTLSFDAKEEQSIPLDPQSTAYILFTSGSTGEPKGVAVPHGALSNLAVEAENLLADGCTVLCATSLVFDVFTTEAWLPLLMGRTVVMADEKQMLLPHLMTSLIAATHVDTIQLTPSRMRLCLTDKVFRENLSRIRRVLLIGEELTLDLKNAIAECTSARIINQYGPTEATVLCSYMDVTEETRYIPIGRPNANCRFYALNEAQEPVLPGAAGELFIAGACLAKGYAGRKDLTDEMFTADPFVRGERMYRSGDMARLTPNGVWLYLGRRDGQIKLDGHRIELSELESAALRTGLIDEAAAVPYINEGHVQALRLFVVNKADNDLDELLAKMRETLPKYMMPAKAEALDALPRTASGKTDKKALAALPLAKDKETARQCEADCEDWMRKLWSDALNTDHFSDQDDFFTLGGTSLTALMILNGYFSHGLRFSLEQFYAAPTLGEQRAKLLHLTPPSPKASQAARQESEPGLPRYAPLIKNGEAKSGDVFLTGASGYLGAHILKRLLEQGRSVKCLTRDRKRLDAAVSAFFGGSVKSYDVVLGDVREPHMGLPFKQYADLALRTGQVIHCAADVRHFAADDSIERTNVVGTQNIINFCSDSEAALCYVSTASVAGRHAAEPTLFTERDVYLGQDGLENAYIRSKIQAEAAVIEAALNKLCAQIMRVGRLVCRAADGKFQQNPDQNAFCLFIRAVEALGAAPESMMRTLFDLTPVDACADALIAGLKTRRAVLHLVSPIKISPLEIAKTLHAAILPDEKFVQKLQGALGGVNARKLAPLSDYLSARGQPDNITLDVSETLSALAQVGFTWPMVTPERLLNGMREAQDVPDR